MEITRFRPTHDWIIVKRRPAAETPSLSLVNGLHRPNTQLPHRFADVIAVGPGRYTDTGVMKPLPCAVGDVVMIREVAGDPEVVGGIEYHWCIPDEVMAVVETRETLERAVA